MSIYATSNRAVDELPSGARVKIIAIVNHDFSNHDRYDTIVEIVDENYTVGHPGNFSDICRNCYDDTKFSDVISYFDFDSEYQFNVYYNNKSPEALIWQDCKYYNMPLSALNIYEGSSELLHFDHSEENFNRHFFGTNNNPNFTCSCCGRDVIDSRVIIEGKQYCNDCIKKFIKEKKIFWCKAHNKFEPIEKLYKNRCCESGFKTYYIKCSLCGKYEDRRKCATTPNGNTVCIKCYSSGENQKYFIKRYHDNPPIRYYVGQKKSIPKAKNFKGYGVELEVDEGLGNNERMSKMTIDTMENEVYTMRDGSVPNGFEIITFPHSEKALFEMNWKKLFAKLKRFDYDSEHSGLCGLHLHISRNMFRNDKSISKMIYFYEKFRNEVIKFSRRDITKVNRWSGFYIPRVSDVNLSNALNVYNLYSTRYRGHDYRYKCVNLQKKDTIEIRIMRGTIDYKTFVATLKFMIEIAKRANEISDDKLDDYKEWLKNIDEETISYMKKQNCFKKLY